MNRPQDNLSASPENGWSPLLTGEDARAAWAAIEAIAEDLAVWPKEVEPHPTLGGGTAGLALFFAYLAEATDEDRYADLAIGYLEDMMSEWESRAPFLSFYSGMTGSGFVLEHLRGRLFDDDEPSEAVAELVEVVLDRPSWRGEYDLINGLVGFGVYGLEMWPRPAGRRCLELVLQHLEARAEETDDGVTWFTPRELVPKHQWTEFPDGYYNLGASLHQSGIRFNRPEDLAQAEVYYNQCLERDPNHIECHRGLAVLLSETGRQDAAFRLMNNWAQASPGNPDPHTELARLLEESGQSDQAKAELVAALSVDPNDPRALAALGRLRDQAGDYQQAIQNYQRSLAINSNQPQVAARVAALQSSAGGASAVTSTTDTATRLSDQWRSAPTARY